MREGARRRRDQGSPELAVPTGVSAPGGSKGWRISAALIGESAAMRALRADVSRLAESDVAVLVTGPTGAGKENVARAIHAASARRGERFEAINCGAIPAHLAESELFGAEAGAFTGAGRARPGRFEAADRGTLFLDEVGELPPELQVKLLRVLETGEITRLGGTRARTVDVRIVAATNRNVEALVAEGSFRADLFWRLAVAWIEVPPLAERREDVAALVAHFARGMAVPIGVTACGLAALSAHAWPGNVRELRNLVDRAAAFAETRLDRETVLRLLTPRRRPVAAWLAGDHDESAGARLRRASLPDVPLVAQEALRPLVLKALLAEAETAIIQQALAASGGTIAQSARLLGLKRTTLVEKMRRMGLAGAGPIGA
jgi:DNA-binding NtrC family response regulator